MESHDTYCNAHESAGLSDEQIRVGWNILASRAGGSHPLFFSRPNNSTRSNYWGDNRIGARGNSEFFSPQVVAANRFRNAMYGQPEKLVTSPNGAVVMVERGTKGLSLSNFSDKAQKVKLNCSLPDGKYTDNVSGVVYTVKKGVITGKMAPLGTAVLYAAQ